MANELGFLKVLAKSNKNKKTTKRSLSEFLNEPEYDLILEDGTNLGKVGFNAYKAIKENRLDSYTPYSDAERKTLKDFTDYIDAQPIEIPITKKKSITLRYGIANKIDKFVDNSKEKNKNKKAKQLDEMVEGLGLEGDELKSAKSYAGMKKLQMASGATGKNHIGKELSQPIAKFFKGSYDEAESTSRFAIKSGLGGLLDGGAYNETYNQAAEYYTDNPDDLGHALFNDDISSGPTKDYLLNVSFNKALEYYDDTNPITKFISDTGFKSAGQMLGAAAMANAFGLTSAVQNVGTAIKGIGAGTKAGKAVSSFVKATPAIKASTATGIKGKIANAAINKVNNLSVGKAVKFLNPLNNPTTTIMGVTAAQDKYNQLVQMGYNKEQSMANALFTGYVNTITEKMGYDGSPASMYLLKGKAIAGDVSASAVKNTKRAIKNYFTSNIGEGIEEIYATVFERAGDYFSKIGYIDENGEIRQRLFLGDEGVIDLKNIGESFLGGFVGGAVMGGAGIISNIANHDIETVHKYADEVKREIAESNKVIVEAAEAAGLKDVKLPDEPNWETATIEELADYTEQSIEAYKNIVSNEKVAQHDNDIIEDATKPIEDEKKNIFTEELDEIASTEMPTVSVGDTFIESGTNKTIKVVSRDETATQVEVTTPNGTKETKTLPNNTADTLVVDDKYSKVDTATNNQNNTDMVTAESEVPQNSGVTTTNDNNTVNVGDVFKNNKSGITFTITAISDAETIVMNNQNGATIPMTNETANNLFNNLGGGENTFTKVQGGQPVQNTENVLKNQSENDTINANNGKTVAYTNDNQRIDLKFKVVSVDDLIVSNTLDGKLNPDYPQELQPRDRSRISSQNQIREMANNLNPARLAESTNVSDGSPIVGPDNVVESGNGRTLAITLAYELGTADEYRNHIVSNADEYGIDVSNLPEKPVLVRERLTEVDRVEFTRKANESSLSSLSATEQAQVDAEKLTDDVLSLLVANDEGVINTPDNKDFISAVITNVFKSEDLNNVVNARGMLSASGLERITNAIFYKAYGDASLSAKLSESLDNDMKNATKVLLNIAPRVVSIKNNIKVGNLYDFDFSADIVEAVKLFETCRNDNLTIEDYALQTSLFAKESPLVIAMAYVFETKNRGAKQGTDFYNLLLDTVYELGNPNQMTLDVLEVYQTKEEIFDATVEKFNTGVIAKNTANGVKPTTKNAVTIPESIYTSASKQGRENDGRGIDAVSRNELNENETLEITDGIQQDNRRNEETTVTTNDEQLRQENESVEGQSEVSEKTETPTSEKKTNRNKSNDLFKKLTDSIPLLENDSVVYVATGNEFEVGEKKLSQQVYEYFESLGGMVHRDNFGDVAIDDKGVDSSIAHGMGRAKAIAFASVPAVIEKGRQIDFVEKWKGRNYDSYVFAAPIQIGSQKAFVAVVVTKSAKDNRYYLHEVSDNEGNIIIIKKDDVSFKSKSEADNSSLGETSSTNIISQDKDVVNSNANIDEKSSTKLTDKCTLTETKRTDNGKDIWVVSLNDRISSDEFSELRKIIREHGGSYSRFAKSPDGKSIPGFIFNSEPTAEAIKAFNDFFDEGEVQDARNSNVTEKSSEEELNNQPESDKVEEQETPVEEIPKEIHTPKAKEDFKVGDILEFDGEQWKCVGIDTMMIDFVNVDKNAFQQDMSVILPYELFKKKTDYKIVKNQDEETAKQTNTKTTEKEPEKTVSKGEASKQIADYVANKLAKGEKLSALELQKIATEAFGGTMANNAFTVKDAYDAMELGVNLHILSMKEVSADKMLEILELLPTQTKRTEEMVKFQQFSTPPSIAYIASDVANINENDIMLEPSAGIGGIAVFAKKDGAKVYVNELDNRRLEVLKNMPFDGFYNENAEQLDNILGGEIEPTVIVMNPPFSSSSERNMKNTKIGAKHIEQALKILAPNGRLVAIVGNGMADGAPAFRTWWKDIKSQYNVKANIGVNGKNYNKYGTSFDIQILVIDKNGPTTQTETGYVDTLQELQEKLGGIRDARPSIDYSGNEQRTPTTARKEADGESRSGSMGKRATSDESSGTDVGGLSDTSRVRRKSEVSDIRTNANDDGILEHQTSENKDVVDNGQSLDRRGEVRGDTGLQDTGRTEISDSGQHSEQSDVDRNDRNGGTRQDNVRVQRRTKRRELTDSIFEQYQTQPLTVENAQPHPAKVSESAAMSAIEPPPITYKPNIAQDIIDKGIVSDVQLEAISYAGQSHSQTLPNGNTRGFFLGDGTGIGKGRTIAGIILDNFNQGRKKAVWVTENESLMLDAKRDVKALFGDSDLVMQFKGGKKAKKIFDVDEAILTIGYSTLSPSFEKKGSNFETIVEWLGKDFDGVIVFDEAHNMANATSTKGSRGKTKPSQKGLAGIALQEALPKAKIVYSSATGATEVENLRYAERLGLWGEGTPFVKGDDFVSKVKAGGIAAMELVARDMKALGVYLSRNISYDDVKYDKITHKLTAQQTKIYDELARSWQIVLQNISKALETTNQNEDGKTRGAVYSAFWGSQQRFFNQILTSMQVPSVIADIEKQLADGKSCVIQLVSTNESAQNQEFERINAEGLELDDFDLTPKEMLMSLIQNSFPVQQYEEYVDDKGNKKSKPVVDSKGNPVLNRDAVRQRDELLDKLGSIKVPSSPIDMIINHFGTDLVAEKTGRSRRVIQKNGKNSVESLSEAKKNADVDAFQNGNKRIMIFSKAGGTGKSYHADKAAKNQQQRIHYLLEAGWQADKAVQGFGRSHRSNQVIAPIFKLVTTNLKGQMRFISTIAKRLDQLGAMTKGQRQAGSQGMFSASDNLENSFAADVLAGFYKDLISSKVEGISDGISILEKIGLKDKILDEYNRIKINASELREVNKFLNRILTLESHEQNAVFDAYSERLQDATERAMAAGTLDRGLENYKADKITLNEVQDIREDEASGAKTKYYNLTAEHKIKPVEFDSIPTDSKSFVGFYKNKNTGKVRAVMKTTSSTDKYGNVTQNVKLISPLRPEYIPQHRLYGNWVEIKSDEAETLWNEELNNLPEFRQENLHLISGVVLPVWDKLPTENVRIYRVLTSDGEMLIGRVVSEDMIDETLRRLGSSRKKEKIATNDLIAGIKNGDKVHLENGWQIVQSRVSNEKRIEVKGPSYEHNDLLTKKGVFTERISYNTRYFVPADTNTEKIIDAILKLSPVMRVENSEKYSVATESEVLNNEQTGSDLLSENSNRGRNASTRKQTKRISDFKRKIKGKTKAERRSFAKKLLEQGKTEKITDGKHQFEVVKEDAYNDDMLSIVEEAKTMGLEVGFFIGYGKFKFSDLKIDAIEQGNKILLRYDGVFAPQSLFKHEDTHIEWDNPEMQKAKDIILNDLSEVEKKKILSQDRYKQYMTLYKNNKEAVWQEFIADVFAGMNEYTNDYIDLVVDYWYDGKVIDRYNAAEYISSIDAGGNRTVLDNIGFGDEYKLSESGEIDGYEQSYTSRELGRFKNSGESKEPTRMDYVGQKQPQKSDTPHTKRVHRSGVSAETITSLGLTAEQSKFMENKGDIRYSFSIDDDIAELTSERKKEIFEQYERDRVGVDKPTQKQIWGERAEWVAHNMTRVFPEIPERGERGTFFAEFRKMMIQWKALPETAMFMTQDKLNQMTKDLTPDEFKTFSELVYFLDLQEEAQIQKERGYEEILLPNEITPHEVDQIVDILNKESTDNVKKALEKRQQIWDDLKEQYITLNQYVGFDVGDRFKRKNYYHHQVIEYMNKGGKGVSKGKDIEIKAGRGWLKERHGSTEAINTDFLAVEHKAMLQMQYDIYVANMLGKIKDKYDIKPKLEKQAFDNNKKLLKDIIAEECTDENGNVVLDNKGKPDSETYRQQQWYNQRIMYGFSGLFDMAEAGMLPTFNGQYGNVIRALEVHNLNVPGLYNYVGELASMELPETATDEERQVQISARTVLKYTSQKKAWVKELLDKDYQTWVTIAKSMSDTHSIHQPRRGNYFYTKEVINEDAFNKAFNDMIVGLVAGENGVDTTKDMKELFEQYSETIRQIGAAYEQWVIPNEIETTMNKVANPKEVSAVSQISRAILSAWKGWSTSVNPLRTVKFGVRNIFGDLDAVVAGNPKVVVYSKQAVEEIYQAMKNKKYTPEFMEWVERGGYSSLIFANEMDTEMQDKLFSHLKHKEGLNIFKIPAELWQGYYNGVETAHNFREAILRYSAYLYFKNDIIKNGGKVKDYVASNRYIVQGLQSVEDKAYQLSKDLLGAYDEVATMGQALRRHAIPFYSFTETNLKRYYRLFENIIMSDDNIPKKAGKLLLKSLMVNALTLLMVAWNKLVMDDEDDELPPSVRNIPHITLGKIGDEVYAFRQLGSFSEILEWIGFEDYQWTEEDLTAPIDKAVGMITPVVKTPVELLTGLNFYPSITQPRAIRDKVEHLFSTLGVDDVYRVVAGKPTKGIGDIAKGAVTYTYDYKESAYYEILDIKREYQGDTDNTIYGQTPKSNALYYMKTAIRYKDKETALKYLEEYFENGGTAKGISQSIAMLNPMYGYTSKDTIEKGQAFVKSLSNDEKDKLKIAMNYYENDLMLPGNVSDMLRKKGITNEQAKNLLTKYINSKCK